MNVIVPCIRWVPVCWREILGLFYPNYNGVDDLVVDLPDSIVEDILSRLPPKCIIQCQRHSKALYALTKTTYFAQSQLQRNRKNSVTVLQRFPNFDSKYASIELYFIDEKCHNIVKKTLDVSSSYKRKDNRISIAGSYDGFLLFTNLYVRGERVYYLWNPITNEKITWSLTYDHMKYVCGFYFCSLRMDYVLLLISKSGARYKSEILNVRTKVRENVGKCSYPPSRRRPPVMINRTLYWMVDHHLYVDADSHFIVSFDMDKERFIALGHNRGIGRSWPENGSLHLIELEGELCICDPVSSTKLELSVLNNKTNCWVKRHTVILPKGGTVRYTGYWINKNDTEVVNYNKGELLVRHMNRLYAYNLGSCKYRMVKMGFVDHGFQATTHVDSLVSFGGVNKTFFD